MTIAPKSDDMDVRHAAAAGLDVHKMQITATVRSRSEEGRRMSRRASSARWPAASPFSCSGCSACG